MPREKTPAVSAVKLKETKLIELPHAPGKALPATSMSEKNAESSPKSKSRGVISKVCVYAEDVDKSADTATTMGNNEHTH